MLEIILYLQYFIGSNELLKVVLTIIKYWHWGMIGEPLLREPQRGRLPDRHTPPVPRSTLGGRMLSAHVARAGRIGRFVGSDGIQPRTTPVAAQLPSVTF